MTRMETLLLSMAPTMPTSCRFIGAAMSVVQEYPDTPARQRAIDCLAEMIAGQREICRCFNNLRSLVGTIEREQGNPAPQFYEGEIRPAGNLPIPQCTCGQCFPK